MDEKIALVLIFIESSGTLAPMLFIVFHVLRQFLFIPVAIVCMSGGILFGAALGTVYSTIGLTLSSMLFYFLFRKMPATFNKILRMKEKWLGTKVHFTVGQIAVLRLFPFIHFHLLSLCLIDMCKNPYTYFKSSLITTFPMALFYTVFGQFLREFSPTIMIVILLSTLLLFYLFREKQVIIKWRDFFANK